MHRNRCSQAGVIAAACSSDSRMAYVDYRDVAEAFTGDRLGYGPGMYIRHDGARFMGEALGPNVSAETRAAAVGRPDGMPQGPLRDGLATMTDHHDAHGFMEATAWRSKPWWAATLPDYVAELAR